jgi:hypothetical protein
VNENSKVKEYHPVVYTNEIHDNLSLDEVATESMGDIVDFVATFKSNHEQRYD